jgi:hypothetical protein
MKKFLICFSIGAFSLVGCSSMQGNGMQLSFDSRPVSVDSSRNVNVPTLTWKTEFGDGVKDKKSDEQRFNLSDGLTTENLVVGFAVVSGLVFLNTAMNTKSALSK